MPVHIIIHRGSHEIGGNCIEVATESTRLILDVGLPLFRRDQEPYDSLALRQKSKSELEAEGILPKVPGLFGEGDRPAAILLSHAHLDHTGLLCHSDDSIPIFATRGTSKMMVAGYRFAGQPSLPRERFREVTPGQPFQIGDATITGFSVDHSIYGALAFLIEAEGKRILYSGDLRLHGRKPGMAKSLIAAVSAKPIDLLLMEGTHIGHPDHRGTTEYELESQLSGHIAAAPGLVLASFSPQHVDRLVGFLRATRKSGRAFVADAYTAYILHLLRNEASLPPPESTEWIRVFFPKYLRENLRRKRLENHFALMAPANVEIEEIRANPKRFVMLFRPSMLDSDFDGTLPQSSRLLFSSWRGYLDRPDWASVRAALAEGSGALVEAHTSGHIHGGDIARFVELVRPKMLVPIHTFEPEQFLRLPTHVRLLLDGKATLI